MQRVQPAQVACIMLIHCVSGKKRHPFIFVITYHHTILKHFLSETSPREFETNKYVQHATGTGAMKLLNFG